MQAIYTHQYHLHLRTNENSRRFFSLFLFLGLSRVLYATNQYRPDINLFRGNGNDLFCNLYRKQKSIQASNWRLAALSKITIIRTNQVFIYTIQAEHIQHIVNRWPIHLMLWDVKRTEMVRWFCANSDLFHIRLFRKEMERWFSSRQKKNMDYSENTM